MRRYTALGLMSGSSGDGIDAAVVEFYLEGEQWGFQLQKTGTWAYPLSWQQKLSKAPFLRAERFFALQSAYTLWVARKIRKWLTCPVQLVGWHPPTIFHNPEHKISWALGDGELLAALIQIPVVWHWRMKNMALNGQGAPLIAVADKYLFPQIPLWVNLGGIANITHLPVAQAWDIVPCNQILNYAARALGLAYDPQGSYARQGKIYRPLWEACHQDPFLALLPPKSLSNAYVRDYYLSRVAQALEETSVQDVLRTLTEFIGEQIGGVLAGQEPYALTGGGAFNTFLCERIQAYAGHAAQTVPRRVQRYREAIGFAFLAVLRYEGKVNCLASFCGGLDCVGGILSLPA
ncbi:MAG: anhydro-N-acetylmuramic acid kinase [Bacteroidia bacterium]